MLGNLALLYSTWHSGKERRDGNHRPPMGMGRPEELLEDLKFTPPQLQQFEALRDTHRTRMRTLEQESKELHRELFEEVKNGQSSTPKEDSLINLLAANKKGMEIATFQHLVGIRAICKDKQVGDFDTILGELFKILSDRPERRPPSRP